MISVEIVTVILVGEGMLLKVPFPLGTVLFKNICIYLVIFVFSLKGIWERKVSIWRPSHILPSNKSEQVYVLLRVFISSYISVLLWDVLELCLSISFV